MGYYLDRSVDYGFDEAIRRVTDALAAEGFGILTEIDVAATFKKKLDLDFRPYRILGTCNAALAVQALAAEPHIGALMPCNATVQQQADGTVQVSIMNPAILVPTTGNPAMQAVQDEVLARIERVLAAL